MNGWRIGNGVWIMASSTHYNNLLNLPPLLSPDRRQVVDTVFQWYK